MKFKLMLAVAMTAMVLCAPVLRADVLTANAVGTSTFAAGTLASLDSFEWQTAPAFTRLASLRRSAAVALRNQRMSVEQAQAVQEQADRARLLLDRALSTCDQHPKSGKCRGNTAKATALLKQAALTIDAIKVP